MSVARYLYKTWMFLFFSLKAVRTKVWVQKLKSPLFNTETYAHSLEGLFERMWKREEASQKPDHLAEPWWELCCLSDLFIAGLWIKLTLFAKNITSTKWCENVSFTSSAVLLWSPWSGLCKSALIFFVDILISKVKCLALYLYLYIIRFLLFGVLVHENTRAVPPSPFICCVHELVYLCIRVLIIQETGENG